MFNSYKKNLLRVDRVLLVALGLLVVFGLVTLYSATLSLERNFMLSQVISTIVGIGAVALLLFLDQEYIKRLYIPIYITCIFLLLLVLLFGTGEEAWGAKSWLPLGPLSFQPSEFVKIGLVVSLATFIELNIKTLNSPKTLLKILAFAGLPVLLILRQPDAGTAMVFMFFIAVMLFTAGLDIRYIFGAVIAGLVSLPILYARLDEFQKNRILNFLDPSRDVANTGYQALQGRIAIGSGQITGRGLFQGVQTQYNFIPAKETDYIFAVLGEELGLLGCLALIALYGIMLSRFLQIARESHDLYGSLVTMGFTAMFLFHIFENIGMTIGVMPITGIPLPFFSFGGTFQLINLISAGIILSISIQKKPLDFA